MRYIGRYEQYQKGLDLLMQALKNIAQTLRTINFHLNMYGANQEGTLEVLKKMVEEYGISDLITLNEAVFGDQKKQVLLASDVFVLTSRFEGLPMGLIEALSYGLPCIATEGTYLSDEIMSADAGWAAENTAESIAEAFTRMGHVKKISHK